MDNQLLRVTSSTASFRLVLLHGWGADAEDLLPLGKELNRLNGNKIELVALRAPYLHPSGVGRQWYGLYPPVWEDVPSSILELKRRLISLSSSEIPLQKTVLLGFSQGGAMALATGCGLPLAGLIACSGYPHPDWIPPTNSPPILMFHGQEDEVVPLSGSHKLLSSFRMHELDAILVEFDGGHEIPQELLPRIQQALESWLN